MNAYNLIANALVGAKDLIAYATFNIPVINYLTCSRREHEIYSNNANASRSRVFLKASTKQGFKPIATRTKQAINRNMISTIPIEDYSVRSFFRRYAQRSAMKLSRGTNIRAIDTRALVDFLESVERESP